MDVRKHKATLCCKDSLLQDYLRRMLEQSPVLEIICRLSPSSELSDAQIISPDCLTSTEVELLQKMADYGSIKAAARALFCSENTVKRELAMIREKLGVLTTLETVVWAMRQGIIR